ncbi:MAG: hypothetical protein ACK5JT_02660, partial [Hyphomicrobiaceae bacterium]
SSWDWAKAFVRRPVGATNGEDPCFDASFDLSRTDAWGLRRGQDASCLTQTRGLRFRRGYSVVAMRPYNQCLDQAGFTGTLWCAKGGKATKGWY